MAIMFKCPKCRAVLTVKDELAGKQGRCPACKNAVTAPRLAPARRQVEEIEEAELVEEEIIEAEVIEEEIEEAEIVEEERPRRPSGIKRRQDTALESRRPSGIKRRPEAEDEDEEIEEVAYLVEDEPPRPRRRTRRKKLGSLAQAARSKHLIQVRILLLAIGILTIVVNAVQFFMAEQLLDAELKKQGIAQVDPQKKETAIRIIHLFAGGLMALGGLYIVFAMIVQEYPVAVTVSALVIYVGAAILFAVLNPASIIQGLVWKIVTVVALAKGIQAAIAYQKERDEGARVRA
ncbi:MAG: hypothetical protein HYS12_09300 [Planctomycetes bacterium]|nr:hypothetical protein [Planctomycetota bacterium]